MNFRIREARKKAGLTQKELADLLGVKNTTLSGYELGDSDPKSETLIRIADICGCSVDYLLCNDRYDPNKSLSADALKIARAFDGMSAKAKAAMIAVVELAQEQSV